MTSNEKSSIQIKKFLIFESSVVSKKWMNEAGSVQLREFCKKTVRDGAGDEERVRCGS